MVESTNLTRTIEQTIVIRKQAKKYHNISLILIDWSKQSLDIRAGCRIIVVEETSH
jgi:hypothetical protein